MDNSLYMADAFLEDERELNITLDLVKESLDVFNNSFDKKRARWPYVIENNVVPSSSGNYSFSTNSMILFTLAAASNCTDSKSLFPHLSTSSHPLFDYASRSNISKAINKLVNESQKTFKRTEGKKVTDSGSFGINDPFSLAWILGVIKACESDQAKTAFLTRTPRGIKGLKDSVQEAAACRFTDLQENSSTEPEDIRRYLLTTDEKHGKAVTHAFILLRYVQLSRLLEDSNIAGIYRESYFRNLFESELHLQLSLSEIVDGNFDISSLVFSLEGILLTGGSPGKELLGRAFEVIAKAQEHNPYFRPLRPFIETDQGLVLFPLSVEVANSLLRTCCLLSGDSRHELGYFFDNIKIFKRYADWLRSRRVKVSTNDQEFQGWHSENILSESKIHLWQTSQVTLFFILYAELFQRYLAAMSRKSVNLRMEEPKKNGTHKNLTATEYWKENAQKKEPLDTVGSSSKYKIYDRIREDFVGPWELGSDPLRHSSMLLYGPPGTGKSAIAKDIAEALQWPMITITPSDFMAGGPDEVEARAKMLFYALQVQKEVVIFFDEIDRLILDRDSPIYARQGEMFQLMTPSMLVKINDLNNIRQAIFIIGTNYEERIDPAIKRSGRIDKKYLVLPPGLKQRKQIIAQELTKEFNKHWAVPGDESLEVSEKINEIIKEVRGNDAFNKIVEDTRLSVFGELRGIGLDVIKDLGDNVSSVEKISAGQVICTLEKHTQTHASAISFSDYERRIERSEESNEDFPQKPVEEFLLLVSIACEGTAGLGVREKALIRRVWNDEHFSDDEIDRILSDPIDNGKDHAIQSVVKEALKNAKESSPQSK